MLLIINLKIGDIININNEETKIMQMLELIERRVELYRSSAYIDLNINDEFMLYDKFTIEKIKRIEEKKEREEREEIEKTEEKEEKGEKGDRQVKKKTDKK